MKKAWKETRKWSTNPIRMYWTTWHICRMLMWCGNDAYSPAWVNSWEVLFIYKILQLHALKWWCVTDVMPGRMCLYTMLHVHLFAHIWCVCWYMFVLLVKCETEKSIAIDPWKNISHHITISGSRLKLTKTRSWSTNCSWSPLFLDKNSLISSKL